MDGNDEMILCRRAIVRPALVCPYCSGNVLLSKDVVIGADIECEFCKRRFEYSTLIQKTHVYHISCPHCNQIVESVNPIASGQKIVCGNCGGAFLYSDEDSLHAANSLTRRNKGTLFKSVCPFCGYEEMVESEFIGETGICGKCNKEFVVGRGGRVSGKCVEPCITVSLKNRDEVKGISVNCPTCNKEVVLEREIHRDKYRCPYCASEFSYNSGNVAPKGIGCLINIIIAVVLALVGTFCNRCSIALGSAALSFCVVIFVLSKVSSKTVCANAYTAVMQKIHGRAGLAVMYVIFFLALTLFSRFCDRCSIEAEAEQEEREQRRKEKEKEWIRNGGHSEMLTCDKCNGDFDIWLRAEAGCVEYSLGKKFRCPHCGAFKEVGFFH